MVHLVYEKLKTAPITNVPPEEHLRNILNLLMSDYWDEEIADHIRDYAQEQGLLDGFKEKSRN